MRTSALALLGLVACGWFGERTPGITARPVADAFGLALGASTAEDVKAWTERKGLDCEIKPSVRRTTTQIRCRDDLPADLLDGRKIRGRYEQVMFAWPDDGFLHHASARRLYSAPPDAAEDYRSSVAALRLRLGEPTMERRIDDPSVLDGKLLRYATTWRRDDLEVSVTATRAGTEYVAVSEVWQVPGVEERMEARRPDGSTGATKKAEPEGG